MPQFAPTSYVIMRSCSKLLNP